MYIVVYIYIMKIGKHLKTKEINKDIHVKVPFELKDKVEAVLKQENLKWRDIIIACLMAFLEERKGE